MSTEPRDPSRDTPPVPDTAPDMGEASARQQELIGPSGGPPTEDERQRRGASPPEDVLIRGLAEEPDRHPEPGPPRGAG
ncbi:MAG: hypothetical protein QM767_22400 [Anaeromyxobacter sp.]